MIQLYTDNTQDTSYNGIILNPISCEVTNKLNGENELELEVPIDGEGVYKKITRGCIITVPTPDFEEPQMYRVYKTTKSMSDNSIIAEARHIFFDLNKKVVFNKSITMTNCQVALDRLLEDTDFTGYSDIKIQDVRQYKMRNLMNILAGDDEDSYLSIFNGELSVNNYKVSLLSKRGSDKGIRVTFGYNLEDIEEEIDSDNVVTRIYPYIEQGNDEPIVLGTSTPYVNSPLISKYSDVYEQAINMSDIKIKDGDDSEGLTVAEARKEMIKRCNKMYDEGCDKIKANYSVKMQSLSKTNEYKQLGYDVLERISLGDTVHCYNKNIDIEVEARCISYKWDCINKEYIDIELGDFISGYVDSQLSDLDNIYRKIVLEKQQILLRVDSLDNTMHSEIKILENEIDSCVTEGEFGSMIKQNARSVQVAWNSISNYAQIDDTYGLTLGDRDSGTFSQIGYDGRLQLRMDGYANAKTYKAITWTTNTTVYNKDGVDGYTTKKVKVPNWVSDSIGDDSDVQVSASIRKVYPEGRYVPYWFGAYAYYEDGYVVIEAITASRNIDNDFEIIENGDPIDVQVILIA